MWPGTAPSRRLHGRSHPGILIFGKSQPGVSEDNFTDGECTAMPTPLYTAAKQEAAPALCHLPDCQVAALTHLQNGVLQGRLLWIFLHNGGSIFQSLLESVYGKS